MSYFPKVVLITGATGDFGKAFAHRFAKGGAKLVLHGRDPQKLAALQAELSDVATRTICFDLADRAAMIEALDDLPEEFHAVDLLINNAGGAHGLDKFQDANPDDFDAMIDSNVTGLVHMTRQVMPQMVARKRGHIINIGSVAGNWAYPSGHVYCAAKAFTHQFSLALRADLQGTHIRVTNIEPGMVETQFSLVRFKGDKARADAVYANTSPLKADDIAESVFWAATLPEHVNINTLEIMPTVQSFGPLAVERY